MYLNIQKKLIKLIKNIIKRKYICQSMRSFEIYFKSYNFYNINLYY